MILIVDMNWKKNSLSYDEFVLPLVQIVSTFEHSEVVHYSQLPTIDFERFSRVLLSGTALKDKAALTHPENFSWIKNSETPILGICAGMQTIAKTFGVPLKEMIEIGMTEVTTIKENPLFSSTFKAYSLHSLYVPPSDGFEVIAKSAFCPQVIKHKRKLIYGVLFHPEVRNEEILKRFMQLKKQE